MVVALGIVRDEAAHKIVLELGIAPLVCLVVGSDELVVSRELNRLVQYVCELMVDGLHVVMVKRFHIRVIATQIVQSHEEYLTSAFGSTKFEGTVVTVVPLSLKIEELREVAACELQSCHVDIGIYAAILQNVSHEHGVVIACRHGIVRVVCLVVFIAVLHSYVERLHEIGIEPVVERRLLYLVGSDDAFRRQVVFRT